MILYEKSGIALINVISLDINAEKVLYLLYFSKIKVKMPL